MAIAQWDELEAALADIDREATFPATVMRLPRGKRSGTQRVVLPEGFRDKLDDATPPCAEAEQNVSGG